jgi:Ser/Thr protein kinase RdoA (MazF antagonist)
VTTSDAARALEHWPGVRGALSQSRDGLINDTYFVGDDFVLQRLHPIFTAAVNDDIAALTPVLAAGGVPVPSIVPTQMEATSVALHSGVWRMLTRLPGRTLHRVETPEQAFEAGRMLALFHSALRGSRHEFAFSRPGAHDTDQHMVTLFDALRGHTDHRLYEYVAPLARSIAKRWDDFGPVPRLPARIGHGDPKISNLLFGESDAVLGVIDLDTMGWTSVDVEVGDALRSWCNLGSEDVTAPEFDVRVAASALGGYLSGAPWLTDGESASLPRATERICLELAARFAADALNESYFGWDPGKAATRGEHNLMRAQGQFALALSAGEAAGAVGRIVDDALPGPG